MTCGRTIPPGWRRLPGLARQLGLTHASALNCAHAPVDDENQRLLLLNARLAVICETIAQLRLERSCRPPHTHAQQ